MGKKSAKHEPIIKWMKIDHLTQAKLAKVLDITPAHVFNIIKLNRGISPKLAKKIEELSGNKVSRLEALYPTENWR